MVANQTNGASTQHAQDKINDQVKQLKQKASSTVDKATEKATDTYENMKKMLNDAGHNIQEQSEQLYDTMAKYVRENPLKAIGMAALAGGVLAIVLKKMGD
jgi:ElaB/YqjD/DUF883 family membrane-anchored ribosome-binding protein